MKQFLSSSHSNNGVRVSYWMWLNYHTTQVQCYPKLICSFQTTCFNEQRCVRFDSVVIFLIVKTLIIKSWKKILSLLLNVSKHLFFVLWFSSILVLYFIFLHLFWEPPFLWGMTHIVLPLRTSCFVKVTKTKQNKFLDIMWDQRIHQGLPVINSLVCWNGISLSFVVI